MNLNGGINGRVGVVSRRGCYRVLSLNSLCNHVAMSRDILSLLWVICCFRIQPQSLFLIRPFCKYSYTRVVKRGYLFFFTRRTPVLINEPVHYFLRCGENKQIIHHSINK